MPEPMTIAIGVAVAAQAVSSVAQYYQSEAARGASAKKLAEIWALFDAIKPPEYDVTPLDPPEYIATSIPAPAFDLSELKPEQYAIAAKYMPEVAAFIAEENPQVVEMTAQGAAGRQAQIEALQQIKNRTGELADAEAQSASAKAMRDAQIAAQSRSDSILQDANRRGQLGSGAQLAAQLQGSSDAMERSANISNDAYLEALRTKMGALRESGDMGRQLAQDDLSQQRTNAEIINAYNQRAAANSNQYLQQSADTRNRGQLYNVETAQDIANRNVGNINEFNVSNRKRKDALLEYGDRRQLAERDFQNNVMQQRYNARAGELQRQNNLKTQMFQNEMERARGKAGIGGQQVANINQSAADRNQAYQGMSDFVGGIAQSYGNYSAQKRRDESDATYRASRDKEDDAYRKEYLKAIRSGRGYA